MGATLSIHLRRAFIQTGLYLHSMRPGSVIKDKVLHPKIPSGPLDLSRFGDKSVVEVLLDIVTEELKTHGDRVCLQNGRKIVTGRTNAVGRDSFNLSDIIPMSTRVAKALYHKHNIRRNDVVQIVLPNSCDYFWPVLGAWLCLAVVSPSDPTLTAEVLVQQMEETRPKVVFCCEASRERVQTAVDRSGRSSTVISMDGSGPDSFAELITDADDLPDVPREPCRHDDLSMIIWSSGSTGKPKGIQYTHGAHLGTWCARETSPLARKLAPFVKWIIGDGLLMTTCFFHLGGFKMAVMSSIMYCPVTFVAPEDIDGPESLFPVINHLRPTTLILGSHHCVQLARAPRPPMDLSSVSLILPFGCNTYKGIERDLAERFPSVLLVGNVYGQTETWLISVSPNHDSIGSVVPECLVRIQDPETGELLGPGEIGEIMARPRVCMDGYLNRPDENSKFFAGDGWVHTGDYGHYDSSGLLHFDSRLKELIKYQNCHLYPIEIEEVIQQMSGVIDVGVFGRPDPAVQELVSAVVVLEDGATVTEDEVVEFVGARVPDYKRLRGGVRFVREIPRNPQGKILRRKLLEMWDRLNDLTS